MKFIWFFNEQHISALRIYHLCKFFVTKGLKFPWLSNIQTKLDSTHKRFKPEYKKSQILFTCTWVHLEVCRGFLAVIHQFNISKKKKRKYRLCLYIDKLEHFRIAKHNQRSVVCIQCYIPSSCYLYSVQYKTDCPIKGYF